MTHTTKTTAFFLGKKLPFVLLLTAALAACGTGQQPRQSGQAQPQFDPNSPVAVAGCPQAPERPIDTSKQVIGGALGAVAGAVVGKAVSKKTGGAVVGAGLGGLFGYLVGTNIAVKEQADGSVMLDIPGAALFDTNQSSIKPQFANTLGQIAGTLQENPATVVCIIGYTDSTGPDDYNQELSVRRAQAVSGFLVNRGVADSRLTARGLGERFPVGSNTTEAGKAQNRRVEMYVRN
ncbi:MAG: OmpA family protein [Limnobacter sp.]|nr:OmpA family protein [Limnobacter sp.]